MKAISKNIVWSVLVVITLLTISLSSQGTGTPLNLFVKTDANGYLMASAASQTLPLSQPQVFYNTRLRTDASGNLLVAISGSSGSGAFDAIQILSTGSLSWSSGALGAASDVFLQRQAANHLFQRNGTSAQRFSVANTYTSTTNFTAFSIDWQTQSNTAIVGTRTAATGTQRPLRLVSQTNNGSDDYALINISRGGAPFIQIGLLTQALGAGSRTGATGNLFVLSEGTSGAASGTVNFTTLLPIYDQDSPSTAANNDFVINRTETELGSGAQTFANFQVASTSRFRVTTLGEVAAGTNLTLRAGAPTVGNVGADSCGTSAATIAGTNTAGKITVGATSGTQCRITFAGTAWTNAPACTASNESTAALVRTNSTTTRVDLLGAFTAADVISYQCIGY